MTITPAAAAVRPLRPELPNECELDSAYWDLMPIFERGSPAYIRLTTMQKAGKPEHLADHYWLRAKIAATLVFLKSLTTLAGQPLQVVVEVSGGVAEVTTCPPGVEVEIVDHDNEKVGE